MRDEVQLSFLDRGPLPVVGSAASGRVISETLAALPPRLISIVAEFGASFRVLRCGETYAKACATLRPYARQIARMHTQPSGLYVIADRTIYLREVEPMVIAHEMGHAVDAALGGGTYMSDTHAAIREAYLECRRWITPIAAAAPEELFAEAVRAFANVNSSSSPWPRATRDRLADLHPVLLSLPSSIR